MQETGSFSNTKNLLSDVISGIAIQKDMCLNGLSETSLTGAARRAAKGEMCVLDNAISFERQFCHMGITTHLGHETKTDAG